LSNDFTGPAYSIANHVSAQGLNEEYYRRNPKARRPGDLGLTPEQHKKARQAEDNRLDEYEDAIELARMLVRLGLGKVNMFLEYELFRADKGVNIGPVDVLLAGVGPKTGEPAYVIIELKRWSQVAPDPEDPARVKHTYASHHPAVQVTKHKVNILLHLSMFADRFIHLSAAAYLPGLIDPEYQWVKKAPPQTEAEVFTGADVKSFEQFLKQRLSPDDGSAAAKLLAESPVLGKRCVEHEFGDIVRGRTTFALVSSQQIPYDAVAEKLGKPDPGRTHVFLIEGGAGTGKTLLAGLFAQLAAADPNVTWRFTSGSGSSLSSLQSEAHGFGKHFVPLIQIASKFKEDELDVVICDEAQALPDHPVYNSFRKRWQDETTMEVVLSRARVVVLLSDTRQRVRPYEVWAPDSIAMSIPKTESIDFRRFSLDMQLRAINGHTYQTWVRRLLDAERPRPLVYDAAEAFKVYVADSPAEMEAFLRARLKEGRSARMTCGFTFRWSQSVKGDPLPRDIQFGDWSYPWNARPAVSGPLIPPVSKWAFKEGGFEQMGSIYAARGHEYDWGGVIISRDLVWRSGRWVSNIDESWDSVAKKTGPSEFPDQVRRTYQTLLTRSMHGTVIYSPDQETRALLRTLLSPLPTG
jgi:hypothetical protein